MISETLKIPLIDFVDSASKIPGLVGVILYGSTVTGELSKKSDIDILLLFDTDHDPEINKEAEITHAIASDISTKYDLSHPFSFVFVNKKNMNDVEPDFLWNVVKEGVVIWARTQDILMKTPHPSLRPQMLIRYSTKNLEEKDKRRFLRKLYTSKKNIISKKDEKLGPGILLVNAEKFDVVKKVFDNFNIHYSVKKFWGH